MVSSETALAQESSKMIRSPQAIEQPLITPKVNMKAAFLGVFKGKYLRAKPKGGDPAAPPSETSMLSASNGELGALVDFNKKATAATIINKINNSSSSFATSSSSSSEKTVKASSLLSTKKAQLMHHALSSQELKQQQQNEMFQENRNFSRSVSVTSNSSASSSSDSRLKMVGGPPSSSHPRLQPADEHEDSSSSQQELKFEAKRVSASSKMKVSTSDGYTAEKMAATNQERKRIQTGAMSYEEKSASSALKQKLEAGGFSSEKMAAMREEQVQLKTADSVQAQQRSAAMASMKLSTDEFTAEKVAMSKQEERTTLLQGHLLHAEKNVSSSSSAKMTIKSTDMSASSLTSSNLLELGGMLLPFAAFNGCGAGEPHGSARAILEGLDDDVRVLADDAAPQADVEKATYRFGSRMATSVERLKSSNCTTKESAALLEATSEVVRRAWAVPGRGRELGTTLCDILRSSGGLQILLQQCDKEHCEGSMELQFRSAELIERCMSAENREYVVQHGLQELVQAACDCSNLDPTNYACSNLSPTACSRVGTGILEHLLKHSEDTCTEVIRLHGLNHIVLQCRSFDVETLRHCAAALANLSLYGGPENQEAMIKHKVPMWLFTLAFNNDDNIKYYACLAISSLVANKEIEADVLKSGAMDLVEPFVSGHNPEEFARSHVAHIHGQSKNWLQRLVAVLDSKREEAKSLAAFHFAMEAGIKKRQGNSQVFEEIGAVEALKKVASSPNAIASRLAAQALHLIGEELPHKLSQQVPLWTEVDVREWVKQIGFDAYTSEFLNSRVDGDLLLQLDEDMLRQDIGIKNGILRKRFLRELGQLKRMADYTSCDSGCVGAVLAALGHEFPQYTYQLLRCGVTRRDTMRLVSEDHLVRDAGIANGIHRARIAHAIRGLNQESEDAEEEEDKQKNLDVFVSYRRSNGSQLASLLKVHLQLRGFSVFLDVERLEAGKFDNNLLDSIRQARHFLLVLTPNSLERCLNDPDCKDWVHKEIVEALQSQCNIIPILDNFQWPEAETLPEDMRAVSYFNGVRWIHDYQDACVDKLERFLRGEMNVRSDGPLGRYVSNGPPRGNPPYQRSASNDSNKGSTCSDKEISNGNGTNRINEVSHC